VVDQVVFHHSGHGHEPPLSVSQNLFIFGHERL
jgi:hypothetical protein